MSPLPDHYAWEGSPTVLVGISKPMPRSLSSRSPGSSFDLDSCLREGVAVSVSCPVLGAGSIDPWIVPGFPQVCLFRMIPGEVGSTAKWLLIGRVLCPDEFSPVALLPVLLRSPGGLRGGNRLAGWRFSFVIYRGWLRWGFSKSRLHPFMSFQSDLSRHHSNDTLQIRETSGGGSRFRYCRSSASWVLQTYLRP